MNTTKQILEELRQLRKAVSQLAGTDQPTGHAYSPELLEKATNEFRRLQIKRSKWVSEHDISKYLKGDWWRTGDFIREELGFTAFIKLGRTHYYDKEQLIALNNELKARNVNLDAYQHLRDDEKRYAKQFALLKEQVRAGKTKKVLLFLRGSKTLRVHRYNCPNDNLCSRILMRCSKSFLITNLTAMLTSTRARTR